MNADLATRASERDVEAARQAAEEQRLQAQIDDAAATHRARQAQSARQYAQMLAVAKVSCVCVSRCDSPSILDDVI